MHVKLATNFSNSGRMPIPTCNPSRNPKPVFKIAGILVNELARLLPNVLGPSRFVGIARPVRLFPVP
jgi:hypothetical protein